MPNPIPPPPPEAQASEPAHFTPAPMTIVVFVIIIIAGGIILIVRHDHKTASTPSGPSVAQIQQIFQPPASTIPNPLVVTSTSSPYISSAPTTTPQSQLYTNPALGFQIDLPLSWQAKPFSASEIILADQNGPQLTIQAISNAQTSLNTVKTQLQGSPTVRDITSITFQNQPALSFMTTSGQQGLAVIYNNFLYYIIGNLKAAPLQAFRFL